MRLITILLSALLVSTASAETLTVAAASDLNYALKELASGFEQKTGNHVSLSFGASGNFYAQIQNGAPYDLFFSADADYPKKLAAAGLLETASLRPYAVGHLVLWLPKRIDVGQDDSKDVREWITRVLLRPDVKRIAIANPQHAPYGRAAMAALEHLGVKDKLAGKLVLGENVSQAAQFAESGNAQAALIPLSLAISPAMKDAGKYRELPAATYPEIRQVVGIVSSSKHKQIARDFLEFVRSAEGVSVLQRYGFTPASPQ